MQPDFLTGDLVTNSHPGTWPIFEKAGVNMVVSVQQANGKLRPTDIQSYVYYVLTRNKGITGPWFSSDLTSV